MSRSDTGSDARGAIAYATARTPDRDLVRQAVRLHRRSLDQSFLTSLGEPFLQALYEGLLRQGSAFLVTARDGSRLVGFILASTATTRMLPLVMRSPLRFLWSVLAAIVRHPETAARLVETYSYSRKTASVSAELIAIAVQPDLRSQGIGRRLLAALDEAFVSRGVRTYKVTVHREMTDTNRFYRQNGFHLAGTFRLYGVGWNLHVRELGAVRGEGGSVGASGPREDPR